MASTSRTLVPAGTTVSDNSHQFNVKPAAEGSPTAIAFVLNITAGNGSVTLQIYGLTASQYQYPLLTTSAASIGTPPAAVAYRIERGITAVANVAVADVLPPEILVNCVVSGTVTYGVDIVIGA
jgi:hypothetical protein